MKNYLELAQNFIDSNKEIPNEILLLMNSHERQLAAKMIEIKKQLNTDFNEVLPGEYQKIKMDKTTIPKQSKAQIKLIYAAAAAIILTFSFFPVNKAIRTRNLIKNDVSKFVNQLFQENIDSQSYILADLGITEDWFQSDLISDF